MSAKQKVNNAGSLNDCYALSLESNSSLKYMQEIISKEILENCRLQDRKAQRMVYEKLFSSSMRICKRYCHNPEVAMEILNNGFMKVFTQLEKYTGKGSFEGWVHRIMVNSALDYLRSEKKYKDQFINTNYLQDIPEDATEEQQDYSDISLDILYGMINDLPPASKIVFNLYVFENYSHIEISNELGISVGTSKWHLYSARKILQDKLKNVLQKVQ